MTRVICTDLQVQNVKANVFAKRGNREVRKDWKITLSKKQLSQLEDLVGDGLGKVTVGVELKESDFGTAAGCFVSVTLTCGQTMPEIEKAHAKAEKMALHWVNEGHKKAADLLNEIMNEEEEEEEEDDNRMTKQRPKSKPKFIR